MLLLGMLVIGACHLHPPVPRAIAPKNNLIVGVENGRTLTEKYLLEASELSTIIPDAYNAQNIKKVNLKSTFLNRIVEGLRTA